MMTGCYAAFHLGILLRKTKMNRMTVASPYALLHRRSPLIEERRAYHSTLRNPCARLANLLHMAAPMASRDGQ